MTSSKIKGETVPHLVRMIPLVHSSRADVEHGCPELRPRQAFPCLGLRARLGQPEIFQPPLEYWTCRTHSKCGVSKNLVFHHPSPTTTIRESPLGISSIEYHGQWMRKPRGSRSRASGFCDAGPSRGCGVFEEFKVRPGQSISKIPNRRW